MTTVYVPEVAVVVVAWPTMYTSAPDPWYTELIRNMAKEVTFVELDSTLFASKVAVLFVLNPNFMSVLAVGLTVIEASIAQVPIGSVKDAKLVAVNPMVVVMLVMEGLVWNPISPVAGVEAYCGAKGRLILMLHVPPPIKMSPVREPFVPKFKIPAVPVCKLPKDRAPLAGAIALLIVVPLQSINEQWTDWAVVWFPSLSVVPAPMLPNKFVLAVWVVNIFWAAAAVIVS